MNLGTTLVSPTVLILEIQIIHFEELLLNNFFGDYFSPSDLFVLEFLLFICETPRSLILCFLSFLLY